MSRPWKIKLYNSLAKDAKYLQEKRFHEMRIEHLQMRNESTWTDIEVGYAILSLRWLDEKVNAGRPVKGYDPLRQFIMLNRHRVSWK